MTNSSRHRAPAWPTVVCLGLLTGTASAIDLSNNLAQATGGVESASGDRWLAASFATDGNTYTLNSVTLLLANTTAGSAQLSIYSNGGLEPGSLLAVLNSPATYPASLAQATFTSSGVTLNPGTTYWVVLRAVSGQFDWGWAGDASGSGVGFQHSWGPTPDAGASWWTYDSYPTQMAVAATLGSFCYANCDTSTTAPILNVADFSCFLNRFAAGDSYANCDNSTTAPTLNVADFACFLNAFATGCN